MIVWTTQTSLKLTLGLFSHCLSVCWQTPAWLEQMIAHTTWRDLFYKLAEAHPDCLMLNFTVKVGRGPESEKRQKRSWVTVILVGWLVGHLSPLKDHICFFGKGLHRFTFSKPYIEKEKHRICICFWIISGVLGFCRNIFIESVVSQEGPLGMPGLSPSS